MEYKWPLCIHSTRNHTESTLILLQHFSLFSVIEFWFEFLQNGIIFPGSGQNFLKKKIHEYCLGKNWTEWWLISGFSQILDSWVVQTSILSFLIMCQKYVQGHLWGILSVLRKVVRTNSYPFLGQLSLKVWLGINMNPVSFHMIKELTEKYNWAAAV